MAFNKKFSFEAKDYLADFLVVAFLAGLMPAALAILAAAALRREAVFFFMRSFLTALSYSD